MEKELEEATEAIRWALSNSKQDDMNESALPISILATAYRKLLANNNGKLPSHPPFVDDHDGNHGPNSMESDHFQQYAVPTLRMFDIPECVCLGILDYCDLSKVTANTDPEDYETWTPEFSAIRTTMSDLAILWYVTSFYYGMDSVVWFRVAYNVIESNAFHDSGGSFDLDDFVKVIVETVDFHQRNEDVPWVRRSYGDGWVTQKWGDTKMLAPEESLLCEHTEDAIRPPDLWIPSVREEYQKIRSSSYYKISSLDAAAWANRIAYPEGSDRLSYEPYIRHHADVSNEEFTEWEAFDWASHGFAPLDALDWKANGLIGAHKASELRDGGMSPRSASGSPEVIIDSHFL